MSVTFPLTAPGALLPLDAPLPQPRRFTLLDAAQIVGSADERWTAGAWINGYPNASPVAHDPCSDGTYRLKAAEATDARPFAGSFTVVIGGTCTARSVGPTIDEYKTRLRLAFEAVEAEAVERVFADGLAGSNLGAYLGDPNMEVLGSGAVTPIEGLALLEKEISENGNGMIHVAPATATYWASEHLIAPASTGGVTQMRTVLGTLVSVGAGYNDVVPDGQGGLPGDQEWAFASSFVQIRRSEISVMPGTYSQALDRSVNEVAIYAERDYLITWVGRQDTSDANHIQAGVLVDRI